MNDPAEDISLRALDRLSPEEARRLDSRLAEDPELAAELRAAEDAVISAWSAASPLRRAPADTLPELHARLRQATKRRRVLPIALAVSGWAAALVLLIALAGSRDSAPGPKGVLTEKPPQHPMAGAGDSSAEPARRPPKFRDRGTEPEKLRAVIRDLRAELADTRERQSGPRVRELRVPGDPARHRPEDRAQALLELLTATLADTVARRHETAATLVVEDGWLGEAFAALPEDGVIRHRDFPVDDFAEYGLLRSPEGDFYDPATGFLWTAAPDGGGYLGRAAPEEIDTRLFDATAPEEPAETEPEEIDPPGGYLVYNGDDSMTAIIDHASNRGDNPGASADLVASFGRGGDPLPLDQTGAFSGGDDSGFATYRIPELFGDASASGPVTILRRNPDGTYSAILTESP